GAYSDSRHPDRAVFGASLEEDLSRRDFTINAMAYNPKTGLVDLFGGELDIENKTVRCVGDPGKRFHEDALRIMRALRFASEFDLSIDKKTLAAMAESRELLRHISAERVSAELSRLLVGDGAERVLTAYAPSILAVPIPELSALIGFRQNNPAHDLDVWAHTAKAVAAAPKDHAIRLSLLLHDIAKPLSYTEDESGIGHFYGHEAQGADMSKEILHRLRYSNEIIVAAVELILHHDADIDASTKSVKRWLNRLGEDRFRQLLTVQRADAAAYTKEYTEKKHTLLDAVEPLLDETIRQDQCFSLRDLAVNGKDLIELGMPQGEALGKILHELLGFVLNEEADNSRESLLAVAASIIGDKYGK
ncbi:MAG: HD domain-containing protein, partial [Eubacteriaceae bacterium]|nr:HD domain-containing protein [Eubacteriaceae bacterium]